MQEFKVAPAVSLRILELLAYLRDCFSLPGHLDRCQKPPIMTRNAAVRCTFLECIVSAGVAAEACSSRSPRGRIMRMHIVGLCRTISRRMAINASRMSEHFADFGKDCA
jgi:hypothetical protein